MSVALEIILSLEHLPNLVDTLRCRTSAVCAVMVFKGVHEVIVCRAVIVIPIVNADFTRAVGIGFADEESSAGPGARTETEIHLAVQSGAGFDIIAS